MKPIIFTVKFSLLSLKLRYLINHYSGLNTPWSNTKYVLSLLILPCFLYCQLPLTESLESDGEGTRYVSNSFTNNNGCDTDWFRRTENSTCPIASHCFNDLQSGASNVDGNFYFGGSDVTFDNNNPLGTNEDAYFVLATEDISSLNIILITIALAGVDFGVGAFEGEEAILIEYAFDDDIANGANCNKCLPAMMNINSGNYRTIGAFRGTSFSNITDRYKADEDLNGVPDDEGTILSSTFEDFTFTLSTNGSSLISIRIHLVQDHGSEDAAFDNIRINGIVLPVDYIYFTGFVKENNVILEWETANEHNNRKFEIEHSSNGYDFVRIGEKTGRGTHFESEKYTYLHDNPLLGSNYYRLKQIDFDGEYKYSKVISIEKKYSVSSANILSSFYPNPSTTGTTSFTYFYSDIQKQLSISIYNTIGTQVIQKEIHVIEGENQLDLSDLEKGVYFVKLNNNTEQYVRKLIVN